MAFNDLSRMQQRFVMEYVANPGKSKIQCAIDAGYSKTTVRNAAAKLLKNPKVAEAIRNEQRRINRKLEIQAEDVLEGISKVAFSDIRGIFNAEGNLLLPHEWDDATAAAIASIEFTTVEPQSGMVEHVAKVKLNDKMKALDMMMRHLGLYEADKVKDTGGLGDRLARAKQKFIDLKAAPAKQADVMDVEPEPSQNADRLARALARQSAEDLPADE